MTTTSDFSLNKSWTSLKTNMSFLVFWSWFVHERLSDQINKDKKNTGSIELWRKITGWLKPGIMFIYFLSAGIKTKNDMFVFKLVQLLFKEKSQEIQMNCWL
jgi:Na+/H+ antiporter NhaA